MKHGPKLCTRNFAWVRAVVGIRVRITIANLCTVSDAPECQHIMIHDVSNESIRYPRLLIQYPGLICLDNIS